MSVLVNPGSEPILVGQTVQLVVKFTGEDEKTPEEPTGVTLEVWRAGETKATGGQQKPPTKIAPAEWMYEFVPTEEEIGRWYFYWEGEGVDAIDGTYVVRGAR